jgi:hypothetical protein
MYGYTPVGIDTGTGCRFVKAATGAAEGRHRGGAVGHADVVIESGGDRCAEARGVYKLTR